VELSRLAKIRWAVQIRKSAIWSYNSDIHGGTQVWGTFRRPKGPGETVAKRHISAQPTTAPKEAALTMDRKFTLASVWVHWKKALVWLTAGKIEGKAATEGKRPDPLDPQCDKAPN